MSGYRGRLIRPQLAALYQLDTEATAADTGEVPGTTVGYDADFKEPVRLPAPSEQGPGTRNRVEKPVLYLPCQVEVTKLEELRMSDAGNVPAANITLVFHFADLEEKNLIDELTGEALLRPGDRLAALYRMDGTLIRKFTSAPLFAMEVQDNSIGLAAATRNLLLMTFSTRDKVTPP